MTPLAGKNSGAVTRKRSIGIATGSTNCARSLKEVGLRWFLPHMTKLTTTLWSCGIFFWVEPPRERPASHRVMPDRPIIESRHPFSDEHICSA